MEEIKLSNDRTIKLLPQNVSSVLVDTDAVLVELTDKGLSFDGIYMIEYGQEVNIIRGEREVKFKVNHISLLSNGKYLLIESKRNISSRFLTPVIELSKDECLYDTYHVNTYFKVGKNVSCLYKDCIYLLYKFSSNDVFLEFEKKIRKHHLFVNIIDPTPEHVLVVMKIPECYIVDTQLIIEGKYSQTSKAYQRKVIKFHSDADEYLSSIFNKSEHRRLEMSKNLGYEIPRESELFDKPNLNKEVLWKL